MMNPKNNRAACCLQPCHNVHEPLGLKAIRLGLISALQPHWSSFFPGATPFGMPIRYLMGELGLGIAGFVEEFLGDIEVQLLEFRWDRVAEWEAG
jgi:hypothetical protein